MVDQPNTVPTPDSSSGDRMDSDRFDVDELRAAVLGGPGAPADLAPQLALALLGRKSYPLKVEDLTRVLEDEAREPRLRLMAAQELGRAGGPDALVVLRRGLSIQDETALRGVIKALGAAGSPEDVHGLTALTRRGGVVGDAAWRAVAVLATREAGEPSPRRAEPPELLRPDPESDRIDIVSGGTDEAELSEALQASGTSLRGRAIDRPSARSLRCRDRRFVLLFHDQPLRRGLRATPGGEEVAVLLERWELEGVGWHLGYRVFLTPQDDDNFAITVTDAAGRSRLRGAGHWSGARAEFDVAAVALPGTLPVEVRGHFEDRVLTFDRAVAGLRRRSARQPSALQT